MPTQALTLAAGRGQPLQGQGPPPATAARARSAAENEHGGGSTNIMEVILARRIGISRTQERAAVTPAGCQDKSPWAEAQGLLS